MHDPPRVGVGEGLAQQGSHPGQVAIGDEPLRQQLPQATAAHQLEDEVDRALVPPELVEGDDGRVGQACDGPSLPLDPFEWHAAGVEDDLLERHVPLQAGVPGVPHHPERARAQPFEQAVAPKHEVGLRGAPRDRRHCVHLG